MPPQLLPATAAAFVPRSSVNVVLGSKVELWLTQTLKRINRIKRPLNSVHQHQRCLTETLSSNNAIWTLTSIMLPKAPELDLHKDSSNPLMEALNNFQLIHITAYIVHVDMVHQNEIAFKLTPDSIEALIDYHKRIHCVDIAASTYNWLEKELQVKKLHEEFIQAINKLVYRTNAIALEGLEDEGAGELLRGKSEEVKNNIMNLFHPLLPPPPKAMDVIRPRKLLPSPTTCLQAQSPNFLMSSWSANSFYGHPETGGQEFIPPLAQSGSARNVLSCCNSSMNTAFSFYCDGPQEWFDPRRHRNLHVAASQV
ncbi:hypothetical protein V492_00637 [Pseudogymnoascus sp. VKM F-4246]|nr:hypothetical protein V492_00637 [Pseudogymnoascus sp. VKM F-4246]